MSPKEMAAAYVKGAADLKALVAGMTREQLLARPVAGRWSTLEVVAHIADFDPIIVERMKRILALESPTLLAADENLFVKELHYHERDVNEELAVIESTRKAMARIIEKLTPAQLQKTGTHSIKGPVTLESVIKGAIKHIESHSPFIVEKKKALGI